MNKPLVILDLDETLIYATKSPLDRMPDFEVFDYYIYMRPHLIEFVEKLKMSFDIAIWSSAGNEYVESIIEKLKLGVELKFVWGRNEAVLKEKPSVFETTGEDSEQYYVKPLKKVKRKGYSLERILIIDDTPYKSKLNFGNVIYPKSYKGELEDDDLIKLINYLELIKNEQNFREIEKRGWRLKS